MKEHTAPDDGLSRVLGLPSLVAIIVGIAISQVGLVGVLQGIGLAGGESPWRIAVAFGLALVLALTYASTFAELALMLPSAGGLGSYTEAAIGPFPALLATFSGYVVVNMFGLPAELILFDGIVQALFGLEIRGNLIALGLLGILTVLNIRGTDVFAALQNSTTAVKVVLTLASGCAVFWAPAAPGQALAATGAPDLPATVSPLATSVALFFWCFVAAEFVCPMIEESRNPVRDIPRAMFIGILALGVLYALYAFGATRLLSRSTLTTSPHPHLDYAQAVFGRAGAVLLLVFAATATIGLINGILAGVSRMLYGMARSGQAFAFLGRRHPRYNTPWLAILFMALLCGAPLIVMGNQPGLIVTLVVSAATCWLLAYVVAHLDLIILRVRHPGLPRPFRSPLFPGPQLFGMLGMGYVIAHNPDDVLIATGSVLAVVGVLSAAWVRFTMRRRLFRPVAPCPGPGAGP